MDRCDIVITAFRLNAVQPAAKALQHILGLSPSDAAVLAKSFPCVVRENETAEEAERLCSELNAAGAHAELHEHVPELQEQDAQTAPSSEPEAPVPYVIGDLTIGLPASPRVSAPRPVSAVKPAPMPVAAKPAAAKPAATKAAASASAESAVSGNVQMLDDGFGGEGEHGAALELDYGPGANRASKVEVKKPGQPMPKEAQKKPGGEQKPAEPASTVAGKKAVPISPAAAARRGEIHVRDRSPDERGFLAKVFLPLVLFYAAAPRLCIAVCIAAVSAIAVYQVYGAPAEEPSASAQVHKPAPRKSKNLAPKRKGARLLDATKNERSVESAAATQAKTDVMEWSVATAQRERMHGIHKVSVEWPVGAKRADKTECMLLDAKYANRLDELARTGTRLTLPSSVERQMVEHVKKLQSSRRYRGREFLPICLAN